MFYKQSHLGILWPSDLSANYLIIIIIDYYWLNLIVKYLNFNGGHGTKAFKRSNEISTNCRLHSKIYRLTTYVYANKEHYLLLGISLENNNSKRYGEHTSNRNWYI